jgi:hypothetical protein
VISCQEQFVHHPYFYVLIPSFKTVVLTHTDFVLPSKVAFFNLVIAGTRHLYLGPKQASAKQASGTIAGVEG